MDPEGWLYKEIEIKREVCTEITIVADNPSGGKGPQKLEICDL